jgi:hypothetical protein
MKQLEQKVGFGTALQGGGYQHYSTKDKWPEVPFREDLPSLSEAMGWILLCACFIGVMYGFLWI